MTSWPSTDAHQCHTPAALSKAYLEEPGRIPFSDQQSMRRHPLHTPRISQKSVSEWKFGQWCCDLDENHTGHFPTFSAFPYKVLGIHLSLKATKWYFLIICTLFTMAFLVYRSNHTYLLVYIGVFLSFHSTWHTLVNQRTSFLFNAFNILGRISFSTAAFPDFNPRIRLLPLLSTWRLALYQNQSYRMSQLVMFLLGSTNPQSILSNVKGFPSHLGRCT